MRDSNVILREKKTWPIFVAKFVAKANY